MLLALAQKKYMNHHVIQDDLRETISSMKEAVQAFERQNKHLAIKTLYKAYSFLPRSTQGIRVCADIIETLTQMEAFHEAALIAQDIEGQYHAIYPEDTRSHFNLFRIYANAAEAHENLGNHSLAHGLRLKALDHQLETNPVVDVEMLQLFMR